MAFVVIMQGIGVYMTFSQGMWIPAAGFVVTGVISFLAMVNKKP